MMPITSESSARTRLRRSRPLPPPPRLTSIIARSIFSRSKIAQRDLGRVRLDDLVALAAQELRDNRAHQLLVLDHQHVVRTGLRRRLIPLVAGDLFRRERLGLVHDAGAPAAAAAHS